MPILPYELSCFPAVFQISIAGAIQLNRLVEFLPSVLQEGQPKEETS
jgi:hypothetical protein